MNFPKLRNLHLCFYARRHLLARNYEIQSKHLCSVSLVKSFKKKSKLDFLNRTKNSNVLVVSKMKFWFYASQNLHNKNNGGKHEKSTDTKIENKKPHEKSIQTKFGNKKSQTSGNKKATTEKKRIEASKKDKFTQLNVDIVETIRTKKGIIISTLIGLAILYYLTHLEESPITKRRKFHIFTKSQTATLAKIQSDTFKKRYKDSIETSGTNYDRVSTIMDSIMKANSDLTERHGVTSWDIFIVDKMESVNSIALANWNIFVFSGLLEAVDDDQLAAVLAHGMSHVLLEHYSQTSTWKRLIQAVVLLPFIIVYGTLPVFIVAPLSPILRTLATTLRSLPWNESVEREADRLSVEIVSKACFDPRKVKEFWMAMESMRKRMRVNLLRAHPIHKMRYDSLDSQMPKAFNILHKNCAGSLHPFFR